MHYAPKIISDPLHEDFNILPVLPVIETPQFQALREKRQLGMTSLVFPSARHSRYEHCLGSYRATRTLANGWRENGVITLEERDALGVYAALHDVGHPAFSHVTEDFCVLDDDERTLELIKGELREAVIACGKRGTNIDLVIALAEHTNPLYKAVHDKNVGMEKLDYLARDGHYTGVGTPAKLSSLRQFISFVDGQMAVDEKFTDTACDVMKFYVNMYKEVYLRKALVIAQRMFHKAVHHLILNQELDPNMLYDLTDSELIGIMYQSKSPVVQELYRRLRNRELYREAIVIRAEPQVCETRLSNKNISVHGVSPEVMRAIIKAPSLGKKSHMALEALEMNLEGVIGLPSDALLVVPVFNPERFVAQDLMIYGSDDKLYSLMERRPAHFRSLEEVAHSHAALRICVLPEYREKASKAGEAILEAIVSLL